MLISNNSTDWIDPPPVGGEIPSDPPPTATMIYGADAWVSTNGGSTWTGSVFGVGGANNKGDPSVAIDQNGTMYISYISPSLGQYVSYSTNNGASWNAVQVAPPPTYGKLGKNHLWVDSNHGRLYAAWTRYKDTGHQNDMQIEVSRSTDGGQSWSSPPTVISQNISGEYENGGVNLHTASNDHVYAVWAVYNSETPSDENALGFSKSADSGLTWSSATRIIDGIRGHRGTPLQGSKTMRHNSFPSMTVNQQSGKIFVVWTNVGAPQENTGTDPNIYVIVSSDGAATWSSPTRVDQATATSDQWFPWVACDPSTGTLACIFYDSRELSQQTRANTYVATSTNNGQTWQDFRVSDTYWRGLGINGLEDNNAGDYIGITVKNNKAFPVWSDNRQSVGHQLTYMSPFNICTINLTGDVNTNGSVNSGDVFYLNNYVLSQGPTPLPCAASGDVNCSAVVNTGDVIYLNNYVWYGGPAPCNVCTLVELGTWNCY